MGVFTQKFPFQSQHIAKVLEELPNSPSLLIDRYYLNLRAAHPLGVGWNKVEGIRGWMSSAHLIEKGPARSGQGKPSWETARPTAFARLIIAHDPHLTSMTTLWALHVELAMNSDATVYHGLFAHAPEIFTKPEILSRLVDETKGLKRASLASDLDGVLGSFTNADLGRLGLLVRLSKGRVSQWRRGIPRELSLGIVGYALLRLHEREGGEQASISLATLADRPGALGTTFGLRPFALRKALRSLGHELSPEGYHFAETAGLNSFSFGNATPLGLLERVFLGQFHDESRRF